MNAKLTYRPLLNPSKPHTVALRSIDVGPLSTFVVSLGGTTYKLDALGLVRSPEGVVGRSAYVTRAA